MSRPPNLSGAEAKVIEINTFHNDNSRNKNNSVYLAVSLLTERPFNSYALMDTMKRVWKPKKPMLCREWGKNIFLFRFEDKRDMEWVLRNEP